MKRFLILAIPVLFLALFVPTKAQESWSFEFKSGLVHSFPTPLTIRQSGHDDIKLVAKYDSKPFEGSVYYALRIGRWEDNQAWELELIHHKLYLLGKNKPPEVQHFEITDGYNLILLNWAREHKEFLDGLIYRIGAGAVMPHPETIVRGKKLAGVGGLFNQGLYISGPTAQVGAEKRFFLWEGLFVKIEGKLTASYAHVPIQGGSADVPDVSAHGLFGLGYNF